MNQNKQSSPNHQLNCEICEIDFMSNAEYALHEFTKKHCDNIIRLAKKKPILKKQKTKSKTCEVEKETVKVKTITHAGSFAKYGYFIPGEIYAAAKNKEFNQDYDPYLQKFEENPLKEKAGTLVAEQFQQQCTSGLPSSASLSKKKKKKKSNIKICQFCNVTLLTTPSYEAHMKSPEHILKLKVSGMGVSAHFVKASSDLHTTETKEDQKVSQDTENGKCNNQNCTSDSSFYCDLCELLLNSSHQFAAHITGKYHTDCLKKKVKEQEALKNPPSDKLFCYTCNILLNTVFQYNEHKFGKKHKIKCRALIRKGMTVPPEERVPGIGIPNNDPSQPVYPDLYVKTILERQKATNPPEGELIVLSSNASSVLELSGETESRDPDMRLINVNEKFGDTVLSTGSQYENNFATKTLDTSNDKFVEKPNITFHNVNIVPAEINKNPAPESFSENSSKSNEVFCVNKTAEFGNITTETKNNITMLKNGESLHCSICNENFQWQFQFDTHLTLEDHFKKIIELKVSGISENEILNLLFSDRNVVKPNNLGRFTCSICKVTADTISEFAQHLSCVVHKYTEKDYRQKRALEVKNMTPCDELGMYYCKLCKIGLTSLVEFCQHLSSAKHKSNQKRKKTYRSMVLSQRQRLGQHLKRKYILLQSLKAGLRTRGLITELHTSARSEMSNLEPLEPKIEPVKNVNVGRGEKSDVTEAKDDKLTKPKSINRRNLFKMGNRPKRHSLEQSNLLRPPSLLSGNFFPSMNYSRFPNRPHYGWLPCPPGVRNVPPSYNSHPPPFGSFYRRSSMRNPFDRPPYYQRTPWRHYR